jgi:phosphate transport system permease protein
MPNPDSSDNPAAQRAPRGSIVQILHVLADITEPVVELIIRLCGWSAILFVLAIFAFVFREAFPVVWQGFDFREFFFSDQWRPDSETPRYGILALLAGTGAVTLGSMILAVPLGLGAAIYISEFCSGRIKETLKITIELLAAIPSVVWGFIGVVVLGPIIIQAPTWFGMPGPPVGVNVLNASLVLALMSVPVIVSVGEDSLKAVPDSYREAALSLGASRWEVVYRVLFPAARNGLLAAVLLGVGRAIGETMAVLLCTGHAVKIPMSVFDPTRTLTATIASELGETVRGGEHYRVLFLIGVVLFGVTFVVNLVADLVVKGIRGQDHD